MGKGFWLGIAVFVVLLLLVALTAEQSANQSVDYATKKIEKEINFPSPYSGVTNSTELAMAKIEKGRILIEEGKKANPLNSITGSIRASALLDAGLKEINEGMEMLKQANNATNNSINVSVRNNS